MEPIFFTTPAEFGAWLAQNYQAFTEVWVGFYKKSAAQTGISYAEAVDQALCYGWIDGIRKSLDDQSYANRFTPRTARSNWSLVNIKRAQELIEMGLMQPPGLAAFQGRDRKDTTLYSYEETKRRLDPAYEATFQQNEKAWAFFQSQAPSYQKAACWWVVSAKKEETRLSRLATLIQDSARGQKIASLVSPARRKKE
ncbi:MAG TPA: YdeI/OmpD-associated family protein [Chloroflexia bacterium]|nr:YdeI/OmpD-associated family protein [Chloroflexia bacterium]